MGGVYALGAWAAVVGGLAGGILHAVNAAAGRSITPSFWLMSVAVAAGYGVLALVVRRQATALLRGVVLGIALGGALSLVANELALLVASSTWLTWFGSWSWSPGYVAIGALLPLLLPDGRLPSAWWRLALALALVAVVVAGASWALTPYQAQDFPESLPDSTNPVGVPMVTSPAVTAAVAAVILVAVGLSVLALVIRWRGAHGVERQRLKWVLLGVAATIVLAVMALLMSMPHGEVLAAVAMVPLPVSIGFAVLRYGMWDVDVVISRSLVYLAVALVAVAGYGSVVGLVGLFGPGISVGVSLFAVAVLAPLLVPVHAQLQRRVNRWLHGGDAEPWEQLVRIGDQLAAAADPDELVSEVLPSVAARIGRALRAVGLRLRLTDGSVIEEGTLRSGAPEVALPLEYGGERLGTLEVARPGGFGPSERLLLDRLAGQAAVAVHTVLLARGARRAREAVVLAREEERRQLRRDLHDGVGPSIAALALQIETARDVATADPQAANRILGGLTPRINAVVADIRALVHELRPPTLDELGLVSAVRELGARLSTAATTVEVRGVELPELSAAAEVAVYRVAGEAVTNAVRHADAGHVRVELDVADDTVRLRVADDGIGLSGQPATGLGLRSMRARCEELGGSFAVSSGPEGTTVTARLPLPVDRASAPTLETA